MIIEDLSTLKIHRLSQEKYDREEANGNLDETAIYLTPEEEIDLSNYVTKDTIEKLNEDYIGRANGATIAVDDVSPIAHELGVTVASKNLLDLSSIIGKTETSNGGTLTVGADGGITGSGTPTGAVTFNIGFVALPKKELTLSISGVFTNIMCQVHCFDSNYTLLKSFSAFGTTKIVQLNLAQYPDFSFANIEIKRQVNNAEMSGTMYVQIEEGNTATEYTPYIDIGGVTVKCADKLYSKNTQLATTDANGTVTGLTSIAPNMALWTEGGVIEEGETLEKLYFDTSVNIDEYLASLTYETSGSYAGVCQLITNPSYKVLIATDLGISTGGLKNGYTLSIAYLSSAGTIVDSITPLYSSVKFDLSSYYSGYRADKIGWQMDSIDYPVTVYYLYDAFIPLNGTVVRDEPNGIVINVEYCKKDYYNSIIQAETRAKEYAKNLPSNIAMADCTTVATVAAKEITVREGSTWGLKPGAVVAVKFLNSNTAGSPTLNVNGTGAYPIWYNGVKYTGTSAIVAGTKNHVGTYMFDGEYYVWLSAGYMNSPSQATLGQGYGTCSTAEATTTKAVVLSSYTLATGGIVSVKFTNAVPANATMNINSRGAKAIYYRGSAITDGIIKAGDIATFIYNGQYQLISIDRWQEDIATLANAGGKDRRSTVVIGSSANGYTAADCDYLCDGEADQVEINEAITFLGTKGSGTISFLPGGYNINGDITLNKDNITLDGNDARINGYGAIKVTGALCRIANFRFYPTSTNTTGCTILLNNSTFGNTVEKCLYYHMSSGREQPFIIAANGANRIQDCTIIGVMSPGGGITITSSFNKIINNTFVLEYGHAVGFNEYAAIFIPQGSYNYNLIEGNNIQITSVGFGIKVESSNNSIVNNIIKATTSGAYGIYNVGGTTNVIANNLIDTYSSSYAILNTSGCGPGPNSTASHSNLLI